MLNFKSGEMNVEPGTEVLSEGEESPHLFTVLRGFATRSKLLPDGRRQVINFVMAGDLIGMQAEMLGQMTHSVTAVSQMTLCVFSRRRIWEIFSQSPERAYDLSWIAAREESLLGDRLISIGRMSGGERVAHGLARLYMRGQSLELVRDGAMPMPYRQRDFADALGLSLVHTNKILGRLREDKICTWRNRLLEVHDLQALCDLAMLEIEAPSRRPLI